MDISFYLKLYLLTLPVFLAIDFLWLTTIAKTFYATHLGYLMRTNPLLFPAFLFYLLAIAGIIIFAVIPGLQEKSLVKTILLGAFFGLCTYATYDLTNYATIKDWPLIVVIVDLLWGTALCAMVAIASFFIGQKLLS